MKSRISPRLAKISLSALMALGTAMVSAQTLRIAASDPVSSVDPQLNNHAGDHNISQHFWPQMATKLNNQLGPGLAVKWRVIDPLTWEFSLHKDAKWSDGQPVTAEDVVFSYTRARKVPGSVASFAGFLRSIESMTVKDPHTLIIKTNIPNPLLPVNLSTVYIVSKHVGEKSNTEDYNSGKAMVTSGPYKFDSYTPGERVKMTRDPNYWGTKPAWETVDYRLVTNAAARTAALLAGDVDMIDKVSASDLERLKKDPKVSVWSYDGLRVLLLQPSFNPSPSPYITDADGKPLSKNPLLDLKVREALNVAINRKAIVDRITLDSTTEANQWMPKGTFGYNPDIKNIEFNPEKAKKLLAEAGYPKGFNLTMHVPGERYPMAPQVAQAIAQFWTRAGVNTKVEVVPWTVYAGNANKNEYAMTMIGWGNGTGEASYAMVAILSTFNAEKGLGASNWGRYSSPGLDQALTEASEEFDDAKREAILRRGVKIVSDEVGIIPLFHYKNIWATRKGVKVVTWTSDRTVAMQATPVPSK